MKTVKVPDWESFEDEIRGLFAERDQRRASSKIPVSSLLFRGQSDSSWQLKTTLERSAPNNLKVRYYYRAVHGAKDQIESLMGQ